MTAEGLYVLCHVHAPHECRIAFAAWRDWDSPLRGHQALGSCRTGGHRIWWVARAATHEEAMAQLPGFVAARTEAHAVGDVLIP